MNRIYDFRCENRHITEAYVEVSTTTVRCDCGKDSTRIISPVPCILDSSFPGKAIKWEKEHEKAGGQIDAKIHNDN